MKRKSQPPSFVGPEVKDFTYALNKTGDYRDTWRIFRIMAEFVEGYQFLSKFEREVTVLGSARFPEDHEYYGLAMGVGRLLGENGFTTITGGGPGIMEAANRGASEAGGESVGLNIQLPLEQRVNQYVKNSIGFYYFFTRKVMLTSPANAFVYFPGGFGTMDEFFEVVDLMELNKTPQVPVVLMGSSYWQPLIQFLLRQSVPIGAVEQDLIRAWHIVDTAADAFAHIKDTKDVKNMCELSPTSFHCQGEINWKIFKIMAELVEGFDFLTGIVDGVNVLGSRSVKPGSIYYEQAHEVGRRLAQEKFAVVTGGGPGLMEAVNKGAYEAGGVSIGINMRYGYKERANPFVQRSIGFQFPFTRKMILTAPSKAYVFFPGGFGTLHQLFEVLTLIQTGKMEPVPVILYDHKFWAPLHAFIKQVLVHDVATIGDTDDELYQIVDDAERVIEIVDESRSLHHSTTAPSHHVSM